MERRFGLITVVLIMVLVFCVKGTVFSKEENERAQANRHYAVLEDEYLEHTKNVLEEKGYNNCGVTMTRVTMEDGSREYTVLLHHRRFRNLSISERDEVISSLAALEFDRNRCKFCYEL